MGLVTYAILDIHEVLALAVDVKPFAAKESTLRIGCETRAKMKSQSKEHFPNGGGVIISPNVVMDVPVAAKKISPQGSLWHFHEKAGYMLSTAPQSMRKHQPEEGWHTYKKKSIGVIARGKFY